MLYYPLMQKYGISKNYILFIVSACVLAGVFLSVQASALTIQDGDVVRAHNSGNVYIVKKTPAKNFKRLIINPAVFDSYGHLSWNNIKQVPQSTLNQYTTSNFVRQQGDNRVYELQSHSNVDTGVKHWVNLTQNQFLSLGFDSDSIYTVNNIEISFYRNGGSRDVGYYTQQNTQTQQHSRVIRLGSITSSSSYTYAAATQPILPKLARVQVAQQQIQRQSTQISQTSSTPLTAQPLVQNFQTTRYSSSSQLKPTVWKYVITDGGRKASGYSSGIYSADGFVSNELGDCVPRGIAIATNQSYHAVYQELHRRTELFKQTPYGYYYNKVCCDKGTNRNIYKKYLADLGWYYYHEENKPASTRLSLYSPELQEGTVMIIIDNHFFTMINGVAYDSDNIMLPRYTTNLNPGLHITGYFRKI